MLNLALTVAEQCVRQMYFRSDALRAWRARRAGPTQPRTVVASQLLERLAQLGVQRGDSLMVHTAISKLSVVDDVSATAEVIEGGPAVAGVLLRLLRVAIGDAGTLLLPAFPKYEGEPPYFSAENDGSQIWRYDPLRTPSKSGLMTEVFRQQPGTIRSRFPAQSVAASGPKAEWFTRRNVEDGKGLAHGPASPYGRLAVDRAHVVAIGVPLVDYGTVIHAPEDARFATWPIKNFWRERFFDIVGESDVERVSVWERVPKFSRGYAEERIRRDLRREGVLNDGALGSVQVHHFRADGLFDLFMQYNASSSYPYYWPVISAL